MSIIITSKKGIEVMKKVVVIGGGVATKGFLSAALDFYEDLEITVIRKYNKSPVPCGIPYTIGTLNSVDENISPDKPFIDKGVRFIINEVIDINQERQEIILKDGTKLSYDKLVLATGAEPFIPPIPGIKLDNVMSIYKDVDYIRVLKEKIMKAKNIVIVGGGFIGVELADEISNFADKKISIIELERNCLSQAFDEEYSSKIEDELKSKGVQILTNTSILEFKGNTAIESVILSNKDEIDADLVLLNIGARPMIQLAEKAGIDISARKSIQVDQFMATSNPHIFAIGDCASKFDFFTGKEGSILLASVAAREGRVAAANLFDNNFPAEPAGALSVFATTVNGNSFASAGLSEKCAKRYGYKYKVIYVEAADKHPGTLPNTKQIKAKFIFAEKSGVILGVQLNGGIQVAEIANLIGNAIQEKSTAQDLYAKVFGTHPLSTSSPNHYIVHMAAQKMLKSLYQFAQ